ncbi:citrate lyase holo-[acyl-carrier protein] synthase [Fructilactobacillus vespulae]|uniref:citrate lyase holo-[acyl-carrier protein] synthase n=1 Tax=Fructilactobacillus vespulae TaxID=1249630 RepID=UPI0039B5C68F
MDNIFTAGEPQDIAAVLENKDARSELQAKLLADYPTSTLVAIKLNIPGPIKNNLMITKLFDYGTERLFPALSYQKQLSWDNATGPEMFLVYDVSGEVVKQQAVAFEDGSKLGRLFDIDVLDQAHGHYSRRELGKQPRTCLICDQNAKECARSRKHSVAELQAAINAVYNEVFNG